MADFSPYQQKIIKAILYNFRLDPASAALRDDRRHLLAEGKKSTGLERTLADLLPEDGRVPPARIVTWLEKRRPEVLPGILKGARREGRLRIDSSRRAPGNNRFLHCSMKPRLLRNGEAEPE